MAAVEMSIGTSLSINTPVVKEKVISVDIPHISNLFALKSKELAQAPPILRALADETLGISIEGIIDVQRTVDMKRLSCNGTVSVAGISYTGSIDGSNVKASLIQTKDWMWCRGSIWIRGNPCGEAKETVATKNYITTTYKGKKIFLSCAPFQPNVVLLPNRVNLFFQNGAIAAEGDYPITFGSGYYVDEKANLWSLIYDKTTIRGDSGAFRECFICLTSAFWEVHDNIQEIDKLFAVSREEAGSDDSDSTISSGENGQKEESPSPKRKKTYWGPSVAANDESIVATLEGMKWPKDRVDPPRGLSHIDMVEALIGAGVNVNSRFAPMNLIYMLQLLRTKYLDSPDCFEKPSSVSKQVRALIRNPPFIEKKENAPTEIQETKVV